ncbi:MAG: FecR family protein, partial [Chitinophagaceae bacterium]
LKERPSIKKETSSNRQLNVFSKTGALASIILVVSLMVIVIYWMAGESALEIRKAETLNRQYVTYSGQRRKVVLKDGTQVWLNADSKLIPNQDFSTGTEREVSLSGEAYFKVASDAARPFIIHTQKLTVKVLGTELNIEAYPDDNKEVASLIKGSIQVSLSADPGEKIILKPHEKVTVLNNAFLPQDQPYSKKENVIKETDKLLIGPLKIDPLLDSGIVETAWMEGKLVFRNKTFIQLAQQMDRWYNVDIHFSDSSVENYRFTGIFSTETIDQALQALKMTSPSDPFQYKIENQEVLITQDKSKGTKRMKVSE